MNWDLLNKWMNLGASPQDTLDMQQMSNDMNKVEPIQPATNTEEDPLKKYIIEKLKRNKSYQPDKDPTFKDMPPMGVRG